MIVDYTPEALAEANRTLAGLAPLYMVNLVRYRAQANYGAQDGFAPCSGREAYYQRYVPAFASVVAKVTPGEKFTLAWLGKVEATLVAPAGESWDDIVIGEYSSFAALYRVTDSPEYKAEAAPHRHAALEDWRFIATTKSDAPK